MTLTSNEFRRDTFKTLDVKPVKEALKATMRKRHNVQLATSIIGAKVAADEILHVFNGYVLGFQLNDQMRSKAVEAIGEALHHGANLSKLLKVKGPSAAKKIKTKSTNTMLLTEIARTSGDMLVQLHRTFTPAKVETVEVTRKTRPKDGTPPQEKKVSVPKYTMADLDEKKLAVDCTAFLNSLNEFVWGVYNKPVMDMMTAHIKKLEPKFPQGFFAAPPKKAPPQKKGVQKAQKAVHIEAKVPA